MRAERDQYLNQKLNSHNSGEYQVPSATNVYGQSQDYATTTTSHNLKRKE